MTYDQRMREERKRLSEGVDDFLRERLSPSNPLKQADELQRKYAREYYHRTKALNK